MGIQKEIRRRFALQEEYGGIYKPINQTQPVVSVVVSTYQQVDYIQQCLDGILNQKTNFPFEIIVGEDDSQDGTREICISYAEKYPDKIRLFLRDRKLSHLHDENGNLICLLNGISGFSRMSARGKYIAFCEGDDYWAVPSKLQKQFDYMERNKDCSLCYHAITRVYLTVPTRSEFYGEKTESNLKFGAEEFIKNRYAQTVSQFARASTLENYPEWAYYSPIVDYPLQMICALQGNIGYIGGPSMAVYRIGVKGSSNNHGRFGNRAERKAWVVKQLKNYNQSRDMFNNYSKHKYNAIIKKQKRDFSFQLLSEGRHDFKRKELLNLYRKYINRRYKWDQQDRSFWMKFLFGKKHPSSYKN